MKVDNLQAVTFVNAVNAMKGKKLPIKISFAIRHNYNLLMNSQVKAYEEARIALENEEKGKDTYSEKLHNLLEEEVDHKLKKVELSEFEKIDSDPAYDKISIGELEALGIMIKE